MSFGGRDSHAFDCWRDPLFGSEGRAYRVRFSEGPACQVRCTTLDDPSHFGGHDKHAPPIHLSEGRACRVRCVMLDNPSQFIGHDKRAPPNGHDMFVPPTLPITMALYPNRVHTSFDRQMLKGITSVLCFKPLACLLGPIGNDDVGPSAMNGGEHFASDSLQIKPSLFGCGMDHAVFS